MTGQVDLKHEPVMLGPVLKWLVGEPGVYVDATLGNGGHAEHVLACHPDNRVVGIDQDPAALERSRARLGVFGDRVRYVHGNFADLSTLVPEAWQPVRGILFDLGVSSPQLDDAGRGFSYQQDALLDMRMNPQGERTAFRLVNMADKAELTRIIRDYGEERWAGRIADFVVNARRREPIRTTGQLVDIIKASIPAAARRTGGHPARRTFQAIRMWVNQEPESLDRGLDEALNLVAHDGRIVVLSFHSLEDRVVKQRFRGWQEAVRGTVLTKKPVMADADEIARNPRSRSAKLRVFQH